MKFPKDCAIERCVDGTSSNPAMQHVQYDAARMALIATDGRGLVIVPVEAGEGDVTGMIPVAAILAARKAAGRGQPAILSANGDVKLPDGRTFPRPVHQFPDFAAVIPAGQPTLSVTLNAKLLANLVSGMGVHEIRMEFHAGGSPIALRGLDGAASVSALLMPMTD